MQLATLPTATDGDEHVVLYADALPEVPSACSTESIVMKRGAHIYNDCYRADSLTLFAAKSTLRSLGLVVFEAYLTQRSLPG